MPRVISKRKQSRKSLPPAEGKTGFPDQHHKEGCLYIDGVIEQSAHGFYHVTLTNKMLAITTARKLENARISLMAGDKVVVEIPTSALNPNEDKIRGRIVWRHR